MNRPVAHKTRRYTLVEILVAMAILVIMMGFLFQFVIGAQRIWSASTRTANVYDQAQLVLQMIEQDLQCALVMGEEEYPGGAIPMIMQRSSVAATQNYLENLFLFTSTEAANYTNVGFYPVLYEVDYSNGVLNRYLFDTSKNVIFNSINILVTPHFMYGVNALYEPSTDNFPVAEFYDSTVLQAIQTDTNLKTEIAVGVEFLRLDYPPPPVAAPTSVSKSVTTTSGDNYYIFKKKPAFVRITLSMYDSPSVKALIDAGASPTIVDDKKTETMRTFTKIVFLQ